ncbi:MAG TPA: TonB-dependent receptor [Pyrinomonadaceae bacterium]|nr:TonB-dependent receptor [Pyrinomonadaceae bacterium]
MKNLLKFFMVLGLALAGTAAWAQDIQTKGSIAGIVTDTNGGIVPNAKVTIEGGQTNEAVQTNDQGVYKVDNLLPGTYTVTIEQAGFKKSVSKGVIVFVGREATVNPKLEAGNISEVVTVTDTGGIDQQSSAVNQNLNDQLYSNVPVARSVTSLFYIAPGTTDSLGGGRSNPSIAGGSALDNLYIADGVNITDSAFGGLGTFSRSYGSLGTGINTSFIKEVQVKTGGFEPQYGQSTGGIINIITKSGSNEFHGAFYGYARPKAFEATRKQSDDVRIAQFGKRIHEENYDLGADVGGPIVKDKLFFFGSFNPTVNRIIRLGARGSGLFNQLGEHAGRQRTLNYALKSDWNINQNHSLNFSIFGDPSETNKSSWATTNIDNTTAQSALSYGTRNLSLRYNGSFGGGASPYTLIGSFSQGKNHFNETGFDNLNAILDRTQTTFATQRQSFNAVGLGFVEPTEGTTYRTTWDLSRGVNLWGTHTLAIGYQYQRGLYSGTRDRSGPHYTVPAANADGTALANLVGGGAAAVGQPLNSQWSLRLQGAGCTLCPLMLIPGDTTDIGFGAGWQRVSLQQTRAEFGTPVFSTYNNYHAYYAQDTWRANKYITAIFGIRGEQERLVGNPQGGTRIAYSFTDQWAPRIGVTVDPQGKGNTKIFYNFGRFFEYLPLDLAERSLSSEKDFTGGRFAPEFVIQAGGPRNGQRVAVINGFGTVNPVVSSAALLSGATNGVSNGLTISAQSPTNPILPGTKLGFAEEHVIGFEQQLPKNFVLSIRYQDRRLKRIVEDAAVVSPESASLFGQTYFIGNVNSALDAANNLIPFTYVPGTGNAGKPAGCRRNPGAAFDATTNPIPLDAGTITDNFGAVIGAVCYAVGSGNPGSDGIADGFTDAIHTYKGWEIELNKRFSDNWQLLSNWRISKLRGNYEGHFRNDNNQTDPAISSLFDFTGGIFNLLGDQFASGPLNTDRHLVSNIYASYAFSKDRGFGSLAGLNLGGGLHMESGVPFSKFGAHPAYLNAGEVPIGGRGAQGRAPFYTQLDMHADYPWQMTERLKVSFIADFFNVFNSRPLKLKDQNFETQAGVLNFDFNKPAAGYNAYRLPFNMRLGLRVEF